MTQQSLELNAFQKQLLNVPEELDVFAGGGRGGGKSFALALLRCVTASNTANARCASYLRKTYAGLRDFELVTRELFGLVYGTAARYNGTEHIWKAERWLFRCLASLRRHPITLNTMPSFTPLLDR